MLVAKFGCLVPKITLHLSIKAGKTDLSKKRYEEIRTPLG
jgi:hypothetical protein